jgi:hypothetical protein
MLPFCDRSVSVARKDVAPVWTSEDDQYSIRRLNFFAPERPKASFFTNWIVARVTSAIGRLFLEHALLVSDVVVSLELAVRKYDGIKLLYEDELALHSEREPFQWRVKTQPVHLFAGLLHCGCGQKMYVFSRSPKYICPKCRNKITIEDIEGVFHDELHDFFVSQEKIKSHLESANQNLADKKNRLLAHIQQIEKVHTEMRKTYQLYQADQITPEGFGKVYKPLEEQDRALTAELPKLQAEVDAIEMRQISAEEVFAEATGLHRKWPHFGQEEKRRIIESIVEKITLSRDTIDITWSYLPSSEELTKRQRNLSGSSRPPA